MNARFNLSVIYFTCFLAQCSTQDEKNNVSKGIWSDELNQRLNKHSCKAGEIHKDTTLLHKLKSGTFMELGLVKDLEVCVLQCCESKHCELAMFKDNFCYGITCYSAQHCKTVPAYGHGSMAAVIVTKAKTNQTKHGTRNNQSENRTAKQKARGLVFYPSDSSSNDLAFSVNLRNIAKHYVHDERVRNVLTAKADEHKNNIKHTSERNIEITGNEVANSENRNESRQASRLVKFLAKKGDRPLQGSQTAQSGKRSETFRKPTKQKSSKSVDWRRRLLKAFVPSSSITLLIVLLAVLAMSRRKKE